MVIAAKKRGLRTISLNDQAACGVKVPDHLIAQKSACIIMQLKV